MHSQQLPRHHKEKARVCIKYVYGIGYIMDRQFRAQLWSSLHVKTSSWSPQVGVNKTLVASYDAAPIKSVIAVSTGSVLLSRISGGRVRPQINRATQKIITHRAHLVPEWLVNLKT